MDGDADADTKTITIETAQNVPENFVTWFNANTTKQVSRKSYDLSTSAKWATLTVGNHNVQIVAKASGYRDSEKSAAVTVNKPAATPTLEAGTYKFKDGFDWNNIPYQPFLFKSNGIDYIKFKRNYESGGPLAATLRYYKNDSNFDTVCNFTQSGNIVWLNNAYKTITLSTEQQVSAGFYKWAITDGNLVKQVTPTGETWLINEIPVIDSFDFNVSFTSNNQRFNRFYSQPVPSGRELLYDDTIVYGFNPMTESFYWINEAYRTVIFDIPPTGNLLNWLQANGIKQ